MLTVNWIKCVDGNWLDLTRVDFSGVKTDGVYVIWQVGNPGPVVRVGQGDIADRLRCHRTDKDVLKYAAPGLRVTWAAVQANLRDGVERYLADRYSPLVGDCYPDGVQIPVNLPGA